MLRLFKNSLRVAVAVTATALAAGCTNSTSPEDAARAPKLPTVSTMRFGLDFLGDNLPVVDQRSLATGKPSAQMNAVAGERQNWINGVVRAIFLQLVTYDILEEPIGAFAVAIHSVPREQPDGSYLWTYIFVEKGQEYSVFLYGKTVAGRVAWRMEVSAPSLGFDHFVWFDGESADTEGFWQFYAPSPATPAGTLTGQPVARVDWSSNAGLNRLRLTANGTGDESGDYLEFQETSARATVDYFDASAAQQSNLTFHADGSGSLTVPDYNNGIRACWDAQRFDAACN